MRRCVIIKVLRPSITSIAIKSGAFFLCKHEDYVFLKAEVDRSQSANHKVIAWVMLQPSGLIETVGCSCMAGLGRLCSHAAAILWKV